MIRAIKIRPNDTPAFTRRGRRAPQYNLPYHARGRNTFYDSLPVNQRILIKIIGYLHGYAGHGVEVMRKRWKFAEHRFRQRHTPVNTRVTGRFVNEYTAHKWM